MSPKAKIHHLSTAKENTNKCHNALKLISSYGEDALKKENFDNIGHHNQSLITDNLLYIHDFEHFFNTLNCVSLSLTKLLNSPRFIHGTYWKKPKDLYDIFNILTTATINIGNEIAGGIAWVNFDHELADFCKIENIEIQQETLKGLLKNFFGLLNSANTRINQTAYSSLSVGIVHTKEAAHICDIILDVMQEGASNGHPYIFPNIQFRVKEGINAHHDDQYHDLYQKSLKVTATQMNPTYIICDSEMNKNIPPQDLNVVGCRSRLLRTKDQYTVCGIGRTNIGVVSLNLPNLGHKAKGDKDLFYTYLDDILESALSILLKKASFLEDHLESKIPTLYENSLLYPFEKNIHKILDEASLSIGFIGGAEMTDYMCPNKENNEKWAFLYDVIKYIEDFCYKKSSELNRIITLIGVSGEGLSYKFFQKDLNRHNGQIKDIHKERGYYTNSFHIPVDEEIRASYKIKLEGPFHHLCNGGGISYIEISHVKDNIVGLEDLLTLAKNDNCNYVGFNFHKNICNQCYTDTESNDNCENCGSKDITLIRRVSGYLGYLSSFSEGKKREEKRRTIHTKINH